MTRSANISKEEFLELIEEANMENGDYGDLCDDNEYGSNYWLPSSSPAKERLLYARARQQEINERSPVEALNLKRTEIIDHLEKRSNFKVGEFLVNLSLLCEVPNYKKFSNDMSFSISVKQEKTRTPGGFPCKMTYGVDFSKDDRFKQYPWVKYFDRKGFANRVPFDEALQIVKYLQLIQRMGSFA